MEETDVRKIPLFYTHGKIFVWNHKDVIKLRKDHRIVGNLVGSLPRAPRQNIHLGLPLQLAPYEAKLLVDIGVAKIVISKNLENYVDDEKVQQFKEMRQKSYEEQIPLFKEARRKEILQYKHLIIEGKKAKKRKLEELKQMESESQEESRVSNAAQLTKNFDEASNVNTDYKSNECIKNPNSSISEISPDVPNVEEFRDHVTQDSEKKIFKKDSSFSDIKEEEEEEEEEEGKEDFDINQIDIPEIRPEHAIVQIFTESLWNQESTELYQNWRYPQTVKEKLQYHVFRDLWRQNYFLTSGNKFGGDFLVYPGDPALFHSFYIAVCLPHDESLTSLEIVTLGRLGANVRKTVLVCSMSGDQVLYTSLQWTGIT